MSATSLRPAFATDAESLTSCAREAYAHYVERIGKPPAPMLEDYARVIGDAIVQVATEEERVVGFIVLKHTEEGFYIDNVAVRPTVKGKGVGRLLLTFAETEARRRGYESIYLATHELMTENRALYGRIGYDEYDHRMVDGYPRVFLRKQLD